MAVLSYSFPLLSLDVCSSLSKEMVECSFRIAQILSVLYSSSLELLLMLIFMEELISPWSDLNTHCEWAITGLGGVRLEFEFAYDISWLLTLGKSFSLSNYDSLRPQNESTN